MYQYLLQKNILLTLFFWRRRRRPNIRLTGNAYIGAISAPGLGAEIVTIALSG
jgi:hypothetical protein